MCGDSQAWEPRASVTVFFRCAPVPSTVGSSSGTQVMFVFSDMNEELPKGVVRRFADDEFDGIDIVAMNIIKLNKDSANPEVYRKRLDDWSKRTTASGARSWYTLIDATKIPEYIIQVKS